MTRKRKVVDDKIQNLKSRKLELSTDIESLTASADQLAEKAESSRDMSILVKSNAMRKASKEKVTEMTELDITRTRRAHQVTALTLGYLQREAFVKATESDVADGTSFDS